MELDKSYFSDNDDEHTELIFYLLNNLFDVFSVIKLEKLSDIIDENIIKSLIKEIEPSFELIAGPLEITYGDENFGIRYANIVSFLHSFERYFSTKSIMEKIKYSSKFNLKENIQINDVLKFESSNLNLFAEIFLILASITSLKDMYIDRVSECEEKYLNGFLNIIEKYVIFNEPELIGHGSSTRKFTTRTSVMFNYSDNSKTLAAVEKLAKKIEDLENDKRGLVKNISQNENDLEEFINKNKSLSKNHKESELKIMDLNREIEMLKKSNEDLLKAHEETYQDVLKLDKYKKQINEKGLEILNINVDHKNQIREYLDKISNLDDIILHLNQKDEEYQSISNENEKLKAKNKEFHNLKEKLINYDELIKKCERQNNIIDTVNIERNALQNEMDNMSSEITDKKEKNRILEFKNKKSIYEIEEMQNYVESLKMALDTKGSKLLNYNDNSNINLDDLVNENNRPQNLEEIGHEQIKREIEMAVENKTNDITKELAELRIEKNTLLDEIYLLKADKGKIKISLEDALKEISNKEYSFNKMQIEKEKIEINFQKFELEFKQSIYALQKQKDDLENVNNIKDLKLTKMVKKKESLVIEIDSYKTYKEKYNDCNKELENIIAEKTILENLRIQDKKQINILEKELANEIEKSKKLEIVIESLKTDIKLLEKKKSENSIKTNQISTIVDQEVLDDNLISVFTKSTNSITNINTDQSNTIEILSNSNNHNLSSNKQIEIALISLKKDIKDLKNNQSNKDEIIRQANDRIKSLELDNRKLLQHLQENLEKYTLEINQRAEDLEFLKRANEDQKTKISREHEMMSSSLYDVAFQFMTLKDGVASTGNNTSNISGNRRNTSTNLNKRASTGENKIKNFSIGK